MTPASHWGRFYLSFSVSPSSVFLMLAFFVFSLSSSALFSTQQTRLLTKVRKSIFKMSLAKWQKVIWKVRDSQHSLDWLLNRHLCLLCVCVCVRVEGVYQHIVCRRACFLVCAIFGPKNKWNEPICGLVCVCIVILGYFHCCLCLSPYTSMWVCVVTCWAYNICLCSLLFMPLASLYLNVVPCLGWGLEQLPVWWLCF